MTRGEIEREYLKSYKELVRFTAMILRDEERAKEVVQEVFARLLKYKGKVQLKTFHTWMLKRIVWYIKREVWPHQKTKKRVEHHTVFTEDLEQTKEEGFMPEYDTNPSLKKAMDAALATLTPLERETVEFRVLGHLTFEEIAQIQNSARPNVYIRFQTALKKLRLALANVGIEDPSSSYNTETSTDESHAA